jgi:hypothetical protein
MNKLLRVLLELTFFIIIINMDVQASLRASRLILRALKLTTM